jgi:hypothetical protein
LLRADGRQEVLDDVILPVADLPVALDFALLLVIAIVDVQPGVVGEVAEGHLVETFQEHVIGGRLVGCGDGVSPRS